MTKNVLPLSCEGEGQDSKISKEWTLQSFVDDLYLLANFTFAICCRPSVCLSVLCRLSVVCQSSVTFVRRTQAVQIFGIISTAIGTLAILWHSLKISRRSSKGTPPPGELSTRRVAKYSDFGPIDGYISETVHDRRYMSFRLVPKSVTLNDLKRHNGCYFALFQQIRVASGRTA